ncbi:hypothetical protein IT400_02780 [Candidatus Nomurabacteria bacterium]|nr:hypothetical protein [Candidatus Nomurabacteria bacterium]
MRILLFRGNFSWDGENTHNGLICWCHIEPGDFDKIKTVIRKVKQRKRMNENVILVPFAHLDNSAMFYDSAKLCFEELVKEFTGSIFAPFGVEKELILSVAADDTAVKFLTI